MRIIIENIFAILKKFKIITENLVKITISPIISQWQYNQ
ncbi:MAG: hypothetical protein EIB84_06395 [Spiroplasma poulsonii]|nr:hypothetical protein [Spiroplasma poulsonii]